MMESISSTMLSLFRGTDNHCVWLTACLQGAWPGLVGDKLASVCRPASVREGNLVIEVLDPDWLSTLLDMKQDLLRPVRAFAGAEIRSLSLVLEPRIIA